jgi:hypothetical protein
VRGRGAAVKYLSHNASFHSKEKIAPSNRGIKHKCLVDACIGRWPFRFWRASFAFLFIQSLSIGLKNPDCRAPLERDVQVQGKTVRNWLFSNFPE